MENINYLHQRATGNIKSCTENTRHLVGAQDWFFYIIAEYYRIILFEEATHKITSTTPPTLPSSSPATITHSMGVSDPSALLLPPWLPPPCQNQPLPQPKLHTYDSSHTWSCSLSSGPGFILWCLASMQTLSRSVLSRTLHTEAVQTSSRSGVHFQTMSFCSCRGSKL